MIIEILVGLLVLIVFGWFPYYAWWDMKLRPITGPVPLPFIGTRTNFFSISEQLFHTFMDLVNKYGKTMRTYFFTEVRIITIDTELIRFLATDPECLNKSQTYRFLHKWLGEGLLTSSGPKWKARRKMITPAYHFKILDSFLEIFDRNTDVLIENLQGEVGNAQIDIYPFINLCALDTICETSMGTRVNAQRNKESAFVKCTKFMSHITITRAFTILKNFDFLYAYTKDYQTEQNALKVLHGYTKRVIKSRREELSKSGGSPDSTTHSTKEDEWYSNQKENFLDLLLQSTIDGVPLTDEDIREEVDTFTFEGHDTVSSGLSFTLFAISNNPDVQIRLVEEQRSIFGNNPTRETKLADIASMQYLEMVIKESLRLYPPVPMLGRSITKDVQYKDIQLRSGYQVMIFVFGLHRDPDHFENPHKFDPDRFLPEHQASRHPYAYIPFSGGHRNCIGQKFAMLEMKATISKILRHFELCPLVPKHKPILVPQNILNAKNGILLKLQKRNW